MATSEAVVPRAHAQVTTASIFFGFISPDDDGILPRKVRAVIADVTCATDDVTPLENGFGFYLVTVVSATTKSGCGVDGATVTFLLLAGEVDPGWPAAQTAAWRVGTQRLELAPAPDATFGAFVGDLPVGPGIGVMRWTGISPTPVEEAVATIPGNVESISYFDVHTQRFRVYIPGAPPSISTYVLVDRGDIVFVRLR